MLEQTVTVLEIKGTVALVEYLLGAAVQRVYVPVSACTDRGDGTVVPLEVLDQGIPYGEQWELLPLGTVGAETIGAELRRRGIWTAADLRRNINGARAALQSAYQRDLQILLDVLRTAQ